MYDAVKRAIALSEELLAGSYELKKLHHMYEFLKINADRILVVHIRVKPRQRWCIVRPKSARRMLI